MRGGKLRFLKGSKGLDPMARVGSGSKLRLNKSNDENLNPSKQTDSAAQGRSSWLALGVDSGGSDGVVPNFREEPDSPACSKCPGAL